MSLIATFFIGLVVGIIAKMLMPGRDPGGFIITAIIGIVGAFVASFLGQSIGWYNANEPAGFIASVIGSMILLGLYRLATGRSTSAI